MSASRSAMFFVLGLVCLGGLAAACGDDDTVDNTSSSGNGSSGTSTSSGSTSGTSGASGGGTSGTSGNTSSGDAGNEAGASSGTSGTLKPNGAACTTPVGKNSSECTNGACIRQGAGGGHAGTWCSKPCANDDDCTDDTANFSGKCSGNSKVCQVKAP